MTEQKFACGLKVRLSTLGSQNTTLQRDLSEYSPLVATERKYESNKHRYKVSYKMHGVWVTYPSWIDEEYLERAYVKGGFIDSPITPARYGGEGTDLIAMWSQIMKPDEFRRTMFSHITKYLFRYPDKNKDEDFNKAMEFIRRLKDYEENTGHYGKEESK